MTSIDYSTIRGGNFDATRRNLFLVLGSLVSVLSVILWILQPLNFLSLLLTPLSVYFILSSYNSHNNLGKSLSIFPNSLELTTRKSHHIIPFEDIITLKFQYQEYTSGFHLLRPVGTVYSFLLDMFGKETPLNNIWVYEIDTKKDVFNDEIFHVAPSTIKHFVKSLYDESGINPFIRDFKTVEWKGTLFYYSFKDLHGELDPDVVQDLI